MYNLYVNDKLFAVMRDTADACRIPVADVLRKVGQWVKSGRVHTADKAAHVAQIRDAKTGKWGVPVIVQDAYLKMSDATKHRVKADMDAPEISPERFRLALAAACLDTLRQFAVSRAMEGLNAHYIDGASYAGAFCFGAEAAR